MYGSQLTIRWGIMVHLAGVDPRTSKDTTRN